jgi:hypothetical protein
VAFRKAGMVMVDRIMKMPARMMQQEGTARASFFFHYDLAMDELLWAVWIALD